MKRIYAFLLLAPLLLCSACRAPYEPIRAKEKVETSVSLPIGVWYTSDALAWENECLPDALFPVFFEQTVPDYPWVLYLGTDDDSFAELLYALCHTEHEAKELAATLSARLAFLEKNTEGRYAESLSGATVSRQGKSVLYTAVPENKSVIALLH